LDNKRYYISSKMLKVWLHLANVQRSVHPLVCTGDGDSGESTQAQEVNQNQEKPV